MARERAITAFPGVKLANTFQGPAPVVVESAGVFLLGWGPNSISVPEFFAKIFISL